MRMIVNQTQHLSFCLTQHNLLFSSFDVISPMNYYNLQNLPNHEIMYEWMTRKQYHCQSNGNSRSLFLFFYLVVFKYISPTVIIITSQYNPYNGIMDEINFSIVLQVRVPPFSLLRIAAKFTARTFSDYKISNFTYAESLRAENERACRARIVI